MKENTGQASVEPLIDYFNQRIPLNAEERLLVTELFKPRLYRKKQYVLQAGDHCTHFNFVVRGCLRMYKVDEKGHTHIIQFAAENWWINDIGSFHKKQPSELNIDALEDTMLLQITREDLVLCIQMLLNLTESSGFCWKTVLLHYKTDCCKA